MVTDRRRLGADWRPALAERIGAAARAGIHIIQIRERDLDGRTLTHVVEDARRAADGTAARIVVNDRVDIALAAGAHGVHLRADSMPASRIRDIVPASFLIGRSVHSRREAEDAAADGGPDYLIFGTVFESASKPDNPPAGPDMLADVISATALPVLAIGGVTAARAGDVAAAGAAGLAAIGLFAECPLDALAGVVRRTSELFEGESR
jgi:thiamine-phosphate pyrophosphorylase